MAGEIQLNSTSFATESSGLITVKNSKLDTDVVFPTFVGMIASFAMSSAPTGWLVCNGAEYAIADYGDLHTAIGTTWGALTNGSGGAGSTHFRVPDLRGAFLRGTGSQPLIADGGAKEKADGSAFVGVSVGSFENDSFQGHYHSAHWSNEFGNSQSPGYLAVVSAHNQYFTTGGGSNLPAGTIKSATDDGTNGTPRKGDETKPFNAGINYCIKY